MINKELMIKVSHEHGFSCDIKKDSILDGDNWDFYISHLERWVQSRGYKIEVDNNGFGYTWDMIKISNGLRVVSNIFYSFTHQKAIEYSLQNYLLNMIGEDDENIK